MTYRKLAYLKYHKGMSTQELMKRFPREIQRVTEVALVELSPNTLQEIVKEKAVLHRLMALKKMVSEEFPTA